MRETMPVAQIAFSVADRERAQRWYARVLGCLPTGGMDIPGPPPGEPSPMGAVQGVPGLEGDVRWAVGRQEFFQLEFFQYRTPVPRPRPEDWRPSDIGYGMVGVHVGRFDDTLDRLAADGSPTLTEPVGERGGRRVCVRDPDGVLLELMEADVRTPTPAPRPFGQARAVVRSIRASVADLGRSERFFVDTLGMRRAERASLHGPEHESLWGLPGAARDVRLLWAGDVWLELVRYADPVARPRPGHHVLSDLGIVNFALGSHSLAAYQEARDHAIAEGYRANAEMSTPACSCTYLTDDQGFSVELLHVDEAAVEDLGFVPAGARRPATQAG